MRSCGRVGNDPRKNQFHFVADLHQRPDTGICFTFLNVANKLLTSLDTCTLQAPLHPPIIYAVYPWGSRGEMEPTPADTGREGTRDLGQTDIHSHGQEPPINELYPNLHVFGLWDEGLGSQGNPREHWENTQKEKDLGPNRDSNQGPSCCEATVLAPLLV